MGQKVSREQCGNPYGTDVMVYALSKVHRVPVQKKYMDMYAISGYTRARACDDILFWRKYGRPKYTLPEFRKILKKGQGIGGAAADPRLWVLKHVYNMTQGEIDEVMRDGTYSTTMATLEIQHQEARKRHPGLPKYAFAPSRSVRFTHYESGYTYKKGRGSYDLKPELGKNVVKHQEDPARFKKFQKQQEKMKYMQQGSAAMFMMAKEKAAKYAAAKKQQGPPKQIASNPSAKPAKTMSAKNQSQYGTGMVLMAMMAKQQAAKKQAAAAATSSRSSTAKQAPSKEQLAHVAVQLGILKAMQQQKQKSRRRN